MTLAPPSLRWLTISSVLFGAVSSLPNKRAPSADLSFTSLGCVSDNEAGSRALAGASFAAADMTVEKCAAFCARFRFFGLEYGVECYCGNSRDDNNSKDVPAADCSFPCPGNGDQTCGAGNRLSLYSISNPAVQEPAALPGVSSLGCFVDNGNRVLPDKIISTDDMTAAKCAANCAGYDYFGTQFGRECYCGSVLPTVAAPLSECSMACSGNDNELCGSGMRLNVYKFDSASTTPPAPTVDGFEYQGCYTDGIPQRVLGGKSTSDPAMTPAMCAASCKAGGYKLFGVEFGVECFCSTTLDSGSVKVEESECTMACGGDDGQVCGGPSRLGLYQASGSGDPAGGNVATIGEFTYQSCWTDDTASRSLQAVDYRTDDMTVEKCADRCRDYSYFGLQFARECYCGDQLGGQAAPEKDCSMLCVGSDKQWCGGPVRLNVYSKSAASSSSSSEPVAEPTTSTAEPSSSSEPVAEPTTSTAEPSSSSDVPATTSEEPSVSSESSSTVSPDTTTTETSTAATTTSDISTTSLFPTSTLTEATTTMGPLMTTITACPSEPTYVGVPEYCYYPNLPAGCERLTSSFPNAMSRSMSMSIVACRAGITRYGMPPASATACFPTPIALVPPNAAAASSTMRSVHSCLRSAMMCERDTACVTNTYPVDQVPAPTPSIGVDMVKDGGFESGTFGAWSVVGLGQGLVQPVIDVSNGRPRTGGFALRARFDNMNSASAYFQRTFRVEPGKQYSFKAWVMAEKSVGTFYLRANEFSTDQSVSGFYDVPANVWRERVLTFTATASVLQLQLYFVQNVQGTVGSAQGINTVWVDDMTLTRLN